MSELAETDQTVRGVVIALEDDKKIRYALNVSQMISYYLYQVKFNLIPA